MQHLGTVRWGLADFAGHHYSELVRNSAEPVAKNLAGPEMEVLCS